MKRAFSYIRHVGTMEDLALVTDKCAGTTPGYFLVHNMQCLKSLIELGQKQGTGKMGVAYWERLQDNLYHTVDDIMHHEESLLWILSTSAGAATLLGLFGTVWGLVHSFVSISEKQTADIATIAPGVAEALVTTLAGLVVAIPALIMFNYLNNQVRRMEQQLYTLIHTFNRVIQIMFVC
jgi:biopolymer transport protein ExbB/TolQ